MKSLLTQVLFLAVLSCSTLRSQKLFEEANDDLVRQIDRMYKQGLGYLAKSQTDGGNWSDNSYGSEAGVVGLATLALLARGDDPEFGPYRITVKRSLDYILARTHRQTS